MPASISALAFDAEGERVAALSLAAAAAVSAESAGGTAAPTSAVLRVWSLDLGIRQRLQQLRGPVPLEPIVCKSVRQCHSLASLYKQHVHCARTIASASKAPQHVMAMASKRCRLAGVATQLFPQHRSG